MITTSRTYTFSAAHHLPGHKGKCARQHGHNYKVEVVVTSEWLVEVGSSEGMVIDFDDLDTIVKPMLDWYDHGDLNELFLVVTTAENLAQHFGEVLRARLPELVSLVSLSVWETERNKATWQPT